MDKTYDRRLGFLTLAILLTLWGGSGLIGDTRGYTDALYWPDYTIPEVPAGGVLEEAGFQPGDSVVSVEGIPVETLGMYSRWPRALSRKPGESIEMVVDRDGALVAGTVVYRTRPQGVTQTRWTLFLFVLSFLWLGMWLLFTTRTPHAERFAMVGLVAALAIPGPNLGSLSGVMDHVQVAAEILCLILVVHFLLLFPKPKRLARSPLVGLLYLPWLALLGCLVAELVAHPRLYHAFGGYIGILFLGYVVGAVLVVAHTALTATRAEWEPSGLGLILAGWSLALVPNLIGLAAWMLVPGFTVPGQRWLPLLLMAIPASMALAVRKEAARQA
ncbi:MAG TPA: PDZ domain-containing protein [Longimicrobiales bacterium]|nr:PDZ domain-containing protein [Longimicrobiales bacterium]